MRLSMLPCCAVVTALLAVSPVLAAEPWGLENEKAVQLQGQVVDLLCEVAGDCPPGCGEGKRQLGLRTTEGRLLPLAKGAVNFANGVPDLLPFCGRPLHVDGLLIESPAMPLLFVQNLRERPEAPWQPAAGFQSAWEVANGKTDQEWFRADPAVKAAIEADGVFGVPGLKPE